MTVLYELSDDPAEALDQVLSCYSMPQEPADDRTLFDRLFQDATLMLTEDDYVAPQVTRTIELLHEYIGDTRDEVRGPLGLYLCLNAAQDATLAGERSGHAEAEKRARSLLEDSKVQECFRNFYGIDEEFDLSDSTLHRVGTTSLILRCLLRPQGRFQREKDVALKCLLPRYHGVRAIRTATKAYESTDRLPGAPAVWKATSLTVAMDFIPGETLEEHLDRRVVADSLSKEDRGKKRSLREADINFIRDLGLAICGKLSELAVSGHHHLDLSPSNIIIEDASAKPIKIRLIDFGHNFIITERVGSSAAFRRAELFVAPELVEHPSLDDWRCDAYSLGIILLVAASKRLVSKEDIGHELDRLWQGDRYWEGAPTLARVIEELIDIDPSQRLMLMDAGSTSNPYSYLSDFIVQETEVMSVYESRTGSSGFGLLKNLGLLKVYSNAQVMNLVEVGREIEDPVDDTYKDFPALAQWAVVAIFCWVFALFAFIALTLADLGWIPAAPPVEQLVDATGAKFQVGQFWQNLPGRAVALSFSLTAVTYYVNDFSMLSPKRIGRRIGGVSEAVMRCTAFFLAIPIMFAMLYDPPSWPICAGIGTSLVVANNFLALCFATRAFEVGSRFSTRTAAGDRFVTEVFKEWWRLMGAYSLALFVIGLLLAVGIAHDEGLFAVLVVVINVMKMYRLNCVELAPQVRGCLSRDILTLRRADRDPRPLPSGVGDHRSALVARIYRWWWAPASQSAAPRVGLEDDLGTAREPA